MKNITEMLKTGAKCLVLVAATIVPIGCGASHGADLLYKTEFRAKFGGNSGVYTSPVDRFADRRANPSDAQPYADPEHGIGNQKTVADETAYMEAISPILTEYAESRKK